MKDGWEKVKLGEICDIIMGQSPSSTSFNVSKNGLPFYQGVTEYTEKFVKKKYYTTEPTKIVQPNTILFSVRAPVGKINITKWKACIGRGNAGLVMNNGQQEFLYYLLKTLTKNIINHSSGTVFDSISGSDLRNIEITIPKSKDRQESIAHILSSLDEKIELLKEQNNNLETISTTLFKRWFVNFEFPNDDGQPYKSNGGKMEESVLGMIPAGWDIKSLGNIFDISIGRTPPREEHVWFTIPPKGVNWISIKDIGDVNTFILNTKENLTEDAIKKFKIPVIPEGTTIVSFKMTVGRVAITRKKMLSNEAIAHMKINIKSELTSEYIYLFLKNYNFNNLGSTSSIVTAVNSKSIKGINVVIPNISVNCEFNEIIRPIFNKIQNNLDNINILVTQKELLLPKLINGEIIINR